MSEKQLIFSGRTEQIKLISSKITSEESNIILFSGIGGIGKSRILEETYNEYQNKSGYIISKIIDLTDTTLKFEFKILDRIAENFNNSFSLYYKNKETYLKLKNEVVNSIALSDTLINVKSNFISDFNKISSKKIILLDTYDIDATMNLFFDDFLYNIVPKLKNFVLIITGRETQKIKNELSNKNINVSFDNIGKLTMQESINILKNIKNFDLAQKVYYLSQGNPLILGLANLAYEISQGFKDSFIHNIKIDDCNEELDDFAELRDKFEVMLFDVIIELNISDSVHFFEMSLLDKRYNKEIMCYLNDFNSDEADEIIKNLKYFFVKNHPNEIHLLHDIFKDKLRHFRWEKMDKSGVEKNKKYAKIIEYYDDKIIELNNLIKQSNHGDEQHLILQDRINTFRIEKYYYYFQSDKLVDAAKELVNDIKILINTNQIDAFDVLHKEIVEVYKSKIYNSINLEIQFDLDYNISNFYWKIGRYKESEKIILELLNKDKIENNLIKYYQTYSHILLKVNDIKSAKEMINKSNEIAKKINNSNAIIWNYYNMGKILYEEGLYEKSSESYFKCTNDILEILNKKGNYTENELKGFRELRSAAFIEMGQANNLMQNFEYATQCAKSGLKYAENINYKFCIANANLVLGNINRDRSTFYDAYRHYMTANDYYENEKFKYRYCQLLYDRGLAYRFDYEDKLYNKKEKNAELLNTLLENATNDFEKSYSESLKYNESLLSSVIHELGHAYWEFDKIHNPEHKDKRVRVKWQESYDIAYKAGNIYEVVNNLLGFCELDFDNKNYEEVLKHRVNLEKYYTDTRNTYPQYWSRLERMEAEALLFLGDLESAKIKFASTFKIHALHGGRGRYQLSIELEKYLEPVFDKLDVEIAKTWLNYFKEEWKSNSKLISFLYTIEDKLLERL